MYPEKLIKRAMNMNAHANRLHQEWHDKYPLVYKDGKRFYDPVLEVESQARFDKWNKALVLAYAWKYVACVEAAKEAAASLNWTTYLARMDEAAYMYAALYQNLHNDYQLGRHEFANGLTFEYLGGSVSRSLARRRANKQTKDGKK